MRFSLTVLCFTSFAAAVPAAAAEIDARPPDRLSLSGNRSNFRDSDADGGGGSLSYLHYATPNAIFGAGVDHTFVEETKLTYGSVRGAWGRGEAGSRFNLLAEAYYGEGDDVGRKFDYAVGVLGISQALTSKFSVQLETRQFDIDTTDGNLPKLGLTYIWTPRFVTNVSYAKSVGGNLGTELASARVDYYGKHINFLAGASSGTANPAVLVPLPGVVVPPTHSTTGFLGIGKTFRRGEVQLLGDYLKVSESEKITVTLTFTAFVGYRGQ